MEKINQKKLAKMALLTASLATGVTLEQSFFNEAQATGGGGGSYYAVNAYNGTTALCACTLAGNQCITYHGWAPYC